MFFRYSDRDFGGGSCGSSISFPPAGFTAPPGGGPIGGGPSGIPAGGMAVALGGQGRGGGRQRSWQPASSTDPSAVVRISTRGAIGTPRVTGYRTLDCK